MALILKNNDPEDIATYTVIGMTMGFFSICDLGIGPTLARAITRLRMDPTKLGAQFKYIKRFYFNLSVFIFAIGGIVCIILSNIYNWDKNQIYVYSFWFFGTVIAIRFSYQDIFLVGINKINAQQSANLLGKFFTLIVFLLTSIFNNELSILNYGFSTMVGSIAKAALNYRYNTIKFSPVSENSNFSIAEHFIDSATLGIYYICSMIVSKFIYYFINLGSVDSIALNFNVFEKVFTYIFLVTNIPTTYFITHFVEAQSNENKDFMRIVKTSLAIFIIVSIIGFVLSALIISNISMIDSLPNDHTFSLTVLLFVIFVFYDEYIKHVNTYAYGAGDVSFVNRHVILTIALLFATILDIYYLNSNVTLLICISIGLYMIICKNVSIKFLTKLNNT